MFKKQDNSQNSTPTSLRPGGDNRPALDKATPETGSNKIATASIGPSIRIKGDIAGNEDLIIHGKIIGSISLPNNSLTVGKQGSLDADVIAKSIQINGKVFGTIQAADVVRVQPAGHVKGDITAPRVVLEDGCQFQGSIDMQEQKLTTESKSTEARSKPSSVTPSSNKSKVNIDSAAAKA